MNDLFKKLVILGLAFLGIVMGTNEYKLLPRLTIELRKAQLLLIQESKASKWGKPVDVYR